MSTVEQENLTYLDAEAAATRDLMNQIKTWRQKFTGSAENEGDRLFAAQLAARLLEVSLRPSAVHDEKVISLLVDVPSVQKFKTSLRVEEICKMIALTGAIHKGHFMLLSGDHSEFFFMFSKLGMRIEFRQKLADEIAERLKKFKIETVIAPVTAGGLLLQDIASSLKSNFAFFDVDEHSRPIALRRGHVLTGRTAIVNDMTTTGKGLEQMVAIVEKSGTAKATAVALVATRSAKGAKIAKELSSSIPVEVLFHLNIEAVSPESCPICRRGFPPVKSENINR